MKSLFHPTIAGLRNHEWEKRVAQMAPDFEPGSPYGGNFLVPCGSTLLRVMATRGETPGSGGWDHLSVSLANRCPTWSEMSFVAKLFFEDHEVAMQLHVPASDHVNYHPYCLHWWRPIGLEIPRPPRNLVGAGP